MNNLKRKAGRRVNWDEFGESIANSVLDAVAYWCENITGDDPLSCYSAHMDRSLYELATEVANWSKSGITESDLKLLRKMPKSIYGKYDAYVRKEIEKIVDKLEKEYIQSYREVCEEKCGSNEKCIEECIHEKMYGW
jgi:hypothetical protein